MQIWDKFETARLDRDVTCMHWSHNLTSSSTYSATSHGYPSFYWMKFSPFPHFCLPLRTGICLSFKNHLVAVVIIYQTDSDLLLTLGHQDVSAISSLPIDRLETPNLLRNPSVVHALHVAKQIRLRLVLDRQPVALQVRILDFIQRNPARLALNVAKEPVRVGAEVVVEAALLVGRGQSAGGLIDVDVRVDVGAGVGGCGRGFVDVDIEVYGSQVDALADNVADALEGEDGLRAVGEGLVL